MANLMAESKLEIERFDSPSNFTTITAVLENCTQNIKRCMAQLDNCLQLWFSREPRPQLERSHFCHSLLSKPRNAMRGRAPGAFPHVGMFQWRPALQAMIILFLRWAASDDHEREEIIQGGSGSPAASLGYALRRLPQWTIDMFGRSQNGSPIIRRLVRSTNSGMRRRGPVSIGLPPRAHQSIRFEIYLDGVEICDKTEISTLCRSIELGFRTVRMPRLTMARNGADGILGESVGPLRALLARPIREEILHCLRGVDIGSRWGISRSYDRLCESLSASRTSKSPARFSGEIERELLRTTPREESPRTASKGPPVQIWHTAVANAHNALFFHCARQNILPMRIRFDFSSVGAMLKALANASDNESPDVLSFGAYTAELARTRPKGSRYIPFMLSPQVGIRLLTARESTKNSDVSESRRVELMLMENIPSSSSLYRDRLIQGGIIKKRSISQTLFSPHLFQSLLHSKPKNTLLFAPFPHHIICSSHHDFRYFDNRWISNSYQDGLILIHERHWNDRTWKAQLRSALTRSWIELQSGGEKLDSLVNFFLTDSVFYPRLCDVLGIKNDLAGSRLTLS